LTEVQVSVSEDTTYTVPVSEDKTGMRIDKFLTEELPQFSRSRIKVLIQEGQVSHCGTVETNPSAKVKGGPYTVDVPPAAAAEPEAQDIPLDVVYEDEHLIVINKPSGLVVHPAAGNLDGTLVNALLAHCGDSLSGIGGVLRPGIVHRLDKDTSGLMVAAKTDQAHRHLSAQFAEHSLERAYKAIVWGVPSPRSGVIEGNIGRSRVNRKKMTVVKTGGKYAKTHYQVEKMIGSGASLVECRLSTGRTHQIRVHMSDLGHPVVGDPVYGGGNQKRLRSAEPNLRDAILAFKNQALHAFLLGFIHPYTNEKMSFNSNIPLNINKLTSLLEKI
jgi:23S rRNA pseudouridine1911/1915/1917 synthase